MAQQYLKLKVSEALAIMKKTHFGRRHDVELDHGVGIVLLDHHQVLDQVLFATDQFVDGFLQLHLLGRQPLDGLRKLFGPEPGWPLLVWGRLRRSGTRLQC